MDPRLAKLITAYQARVAWVISLFPMAGLAMPASGSHWAANPVAGRARLNADVTYFKHGYGLAVHYPSGVIDFDFGPEGQIDGFNLSRLQGFAGHDPEMFGFASDGEIADAFRGACNQGEVVDTGSVLCFLAKQPR